MSKDRFEKTYRPLPDNVQLDYSPIEGMGVFAKYDLDGKIFIGITHIAPRKKDLPRQRTPLGGFINHSDDPNSYIATNKGDRILHTIKPVKAGEEITVYYRFKGYDGIIGDDTEVEIEH